MRADVTGPAARRAIGAMAAAAAAHLRDDFEGLELLLADAAGSSPVDDLVDAALIAAAEIFDQIARLRNMSPQRLCSILAAATADMTSGPLVLSMEALVSYSLGEMERFGELCRLVAATRSPLVPVVSILAGAIRWSARDADTDPVAAAAELCMRVASRQAILG